MLHSQVAHNWNTCVWLVLWMNRLKLYGLSPPKWLLGSRQNKSVFSFLRHLPTWHCSHLLLSKPAACRSCGRLMGQTDIRYLVTWPFHRPCFAYYGGIANMPSGVFLLTLLFWLQEGHLTCKARFSYPHRFWFWWSNKLTSILYIKVIVHIQCLQCFDTVGWATGRASSL